MTRDVNFAGLVVSELLMRMGPSIVEKGMISASRSWFRSQGTNQAMRSRVRDMGGLRVDQGPTP